MLEHAWTRADLMAKFFLSVDSYPASSYQFSANFFALRVNVKTRHFLRHWNGFMQTHFNLCTDAPSRLRNHPSFQENRYDQSIFSLLLKTLYPNDINLHIIHSTEPIHVHAKGHPPFIPPILGSSLLAKYIYQIRIRAYFLYWLLLLGINQLKTWLRLFRHFLAARTKGQLAK